MALPALPARHRCDLSERRRPPRFRNSGTARARARPPDPRIGCRCRALPPRTSTALRPLSDFDFIRVEVAMGERHGRADRSRAHHARTRSQCGGAHCRRTGRGQSECRPNRDSAFLARLAECGISGPSRRCRAASRASRHRGPAQLSRGYATHPARSGCRGIAPDRH